MTGTDRVDANSVFGMFDGVLVGEKSEYLAIDTISPRRRINETYRSRQPYYSVFCSCISCDGNRERCCGFGS